MSDFESADEPFESADEHSNVEEEEEMEEMEEEEDEDELEKALADEEVYAEIKDEELSRLYKCETGRSIEMRVDGLKQQISEITGLSLDTAHMVLASLAWNLDKALALCLNDNAEMELKKRGVFPEPPCSSQQPECTVCMTDSTDCEPGTNFLHFACNHEACSTCWKSYFEEKITAGAGAKITCLGSKCDLTVPMTFVAARISPRFARRYKSQQLQSYMDSRSNMKWCPTPDCDTVVVASEGAEHVGTVVCNKCQETFCYECAEDHAPLTCQQRKAFVALTEKDSGNTMWLMAHTKECPKCKVSIEKSGGCNWIMCRKCSFEFCWVCGRFMRHNEVEIIGGSHRCNVFKDEEDRAAALQYQKRDKDTADHLRLGHFLTRWQVHHDSYKLEQKELANIIPVFSADPMDSLPLQSAQVMGLRCLRSARRMLWNSYAWAYYQKWRADEPQKTFFEDLQHLLETRTEALSKAISNSLQAAGEINSKAAHEHKEAIHHHTTHTGINMRNLQELCRENTKVEGTA